MSLVLLVGACTSVGEWIAESHSRLPPYTKKPVQLLKKKTKRGLENFSWSEENSATTTLSSDGRNNGPYHSWCCTCCSTCGERK